MIMSELNIELPNIKCLQGAKQMNVSNSLASKVIDEQLDKQCQNNLLKYLSQKLQIE